MLAILELWNQHGFKVGVQFQLNPDKLIDPQVNRIAYNFSLCESAILTIEGNSDRLPIVYNYTQSQRVRNRLVREE